MTPAVNDRGSRTTMEEDGAGRRRQFITPWKKAEQGGGGVGWSSDAVAPFPLPPRMSPLISLASTNGSRSHAKDRLARLAAAATWVSVASSSTTLSPRVTQGESNVQIGQRSKKRKSPCVRMPIFPLSRMLLSPRQLPGASLRSPRSPSVKRRISPCSQRGMLHIDLNVELEEENAETWFVLDAGPVIQENTMTCFNPDVGPIAQENTMSCFDPDVGVVAQENAEIWFVPDAGLVAQENTITCFSPDVGPVAQENIVSCFDPDVGAVAQENVETWFNPDVGVVAQENTHRNVVPNDKRRAIFDAVLAKARNGNLKGHETTQVSVEFSVPIRTVQRIWKKGKSYLDQGIPVDVTSEKSRCGRKKIEVDMSKLKDIPMSSRTTIQDVAAHFHVSKSKIHKMKKEGAIKRVSNAMKPYLTQQNKIDRLKWCLSMLDPRSVPQDPVFKTLFDFVFIDEKWYSITRKTERYYTAPNDEQPIRTCKNKNYIPKIMILTALARPRFDSSGNCTFDGKIGCFPFVTYTAAKRSSVNRPAGTMEMKPIESITKDVIRNCLIEKVLPAIRAKWPHEDTNKPIYIQQDNARPHVAPSDRLFCEAAKQDGFNIKIICQPANSPDMNILDLGFFNSIQSIQYKTTSKTTEELVAAVDQAFQNYPVKRANRIFLTLHACMKEVITARGGNSYDVPHIRKGMLERQGRLPLQLKCDAFEVHNASISLRTIADA